MIDQLYDAYMLYCYYIIWLGMYDNSYLPKVPKLNKLYYNYYSTQVHFL